MAEEPYILLSLKEEKAKELSQAISNQTSRKILDYLSTVKDATESDIAKKLEVPISTIHYNLSHLKKAGLVEAEEFHYSKKGKEVNHYRIANKLIIITPKETYKLKDKLKSILPLGVLMVGSYFAIRYFQAPERVLSSAPKAEMADAMVRTAEPMLAAPPASPAEPSIAFWFLLGAFVSILVYLLIDYIRHCKR